MEGVALQRRLRHTKAQLDSPCHNTGTQGTIDPSVNRPSSRVHVFMSSLGCLSEGLSSRRPVGCLVCECLTCPSLSRIIVMSSLS